MLVIPTVVFVCEHGAAKSIVAAAWLQRLAAEAGISLRAVGRGTDPATDMSPAASAGLDRDGLALEERVPRPISPAELAGAWRVVSFGPDLSPLVPGGVRFESWTVPDVSDGYEAARDVVVRHLRKLLEDVPADSR